MKRILVLLFGIMSFSFAHSGRECPTCGCDQMPMWQGAVFGFIFFVLACFIFFFNLPGNISLVCQREREKSPID
jgi:hypothetical protein